MFTFEEEHLGGQIIYHAIYETHFDNAVINPVPYARISYGPKFSMVCQ